METALVLTLAGCGAGGGSVSGVSPTTSVPPIPNTPTARAEAVSGAPEPLFAAVRSRKSQIGLKETSGAGAQINASSLPGPAGLGTTRTLRFNALGSEMILEIYPALSGDIAGSQVWHGKVVGDEHSSVTLCESKGAYAGSFASTSGTYALISLPDGTVQVSLIDTAKEPECATGSSAGDSSAHTGSKKPQDKAAQADNPLTAASLTGFPQTIDMYVARTSTLDAKFGANVCTTLAELGVAQTNACLSNSQCTTRVRLVGTGTVSYNENVKTFQGVLDELNDYTKGMGKSTYELTKGTGADVVMLLVDSPTDSNVNGGIADLAYYVNGKLQNFTFERNNAVDSWSVALDNLSFAHEFAHILGCQHGLGPGSSPRADWLYQYGSGCYSGGKNWRTVMNKESGVGPRVPFFSNPNLSLKGWKLGIPDQAENYRAIDDSAEHVASYNNQVYPANKITLRQGWNQIAFSGAATLQTLSVDRSQDILSVQYYSGSAWTKLSLTESSINNLGNVSTKSVWIYSSSANNVLRYTGYQIANSDLENRPTYSIKLVPGWNLIAFPFNWGGLTGNDWIEEGTPTTVSTLSTNGTLHRSSAGTSYWNFNGSGWNEYGLTGNLPFQIGGWVYAHRAVTITPKTTL